MAIYHLHASTGTRAGGQSAGAKAGYITRSHGYENCKDSCTFTTSGNMPGFAAQSPQSFWEAADIYERANGRLFKEVEFALPRELSADQRQKLAQDFARELTASGLPYTLAIHAGNGTNPHAHLMISERVNDGVSRPASQFFKRYNAKDPSAGGARKTAELKPRDWLANTRERWSCLVNEALTRHNHQSRVDHRSNEARNLSLEPTVHLGHKVAAMERKGIRTERGNENRTIIARNEYRLTLESRIRIDWDQLRAEEALEKKLAIERHDARILAARKQHHETQAQIRQALATLAKAPDPRDVWAADVSEVVAQRVEEAERAEARRDELRPATLGQLLNPARWWRWATLTEHAREARAVADLYRVAQASGDLPENAVEWTSLERRYADAYDRWEAAGNLRAAVVRLQESLPGIEAEARQLTSDEAERKAQERSERAQELRERSMARRAAWAESSPVAAPVEPETVRQIDDRPPEIQPETDPGPSL